jgi:hypothetical protein
MNDLRLDEMRDEEARPLFIRIPSQEWHRPVSVSLRDTHDVRPALAPVLDLAGLLAALNPQKVGSQADNCAQDRGTALEFVIERPKAWLPPSVARAVKPKLTTFEDFLRLADASDEEIRQFASKYGPLFIFGSKPKFEEIYRASRSSVAPKIEESLTRNDNLVIIEQCDVWRYFAGCMQALLFIMHAYREDRKPQASDWEVIGNAPEVVTSTRHEATDLLHPHSYGGEALWATVVHFVRQGSDRDRKMCRELMNSLLELGRVRPWVTWNDQPQLLFSGPSLLSYLALQLCLLALKHDSTAICSYCFERYIVQRAIKAGQQNYCQACRKARVSARLSQRRKLAERRR